MKALVLFAVATSLIVVAGSWLLSLVWSSAEAMHAIRMSALVAVGVQLFAFGIMRLGQGKNAIAAWGLGTLLRFVVFVIYALVFARALGPASTPALLSLALFFFLSTLVEPLLLNV